MHDFRRAMATNACHIFDHLKSPHIDAFLENATLRWEELDAIQESVHLFDLVKNIMDSANKKGRAKLSPASRACINFFLVIPLKPLSFHSLGSQWQ